MKTKILALLLTSFLVSTSFASVYTVVGKKIGNPSLIYIQQTDSIESTGNGTWTTAVFETTSDKANTNYLKMYIIECDYDNGRLRYLLRKDFFKKGSSSTDKTVSDWITATDGSLEKTLLDGAYSGGIYPLRFETESFDELVEWGRKTLKDSKRN